MIRYLFKQNPVLISMLSLCPIIATSQTVTNALVMAGATAFVLILSTIIMGLLQRFVTKKVKSIVFIIVVATLVTGVDYLVQTFLPDTSQSLGIFIPLIAVNCLILVAVNHDSPVRQSLAGAVGQSIGLAIVFVALALVRELFGKGTICALPVLGLRFRTNPLSFFLLPPAGFILLGFYQALLNKILKRWA